MTDKAMHETASFPVPICASVVELIQMDAEFFYNFALGTLLSAFTRLHIT